jgi:hypothetical protein
MLQRALKYAFPILVFHAKTNKMNCGFQDEKCLFDKCQKSTWGYLLNTLTNIETTCKTLGKTKTQTVIMYELLYCKLLR